MFASSTEAVLLSGFAECSRHPVEFVSVVGLLLGGPCGINLKGAVGNLGAALRACDADDDWTDATSLMRYWQQVISIAV